MSLTPNALKSIALTSKVPTPCIVEIIDQPTQHLNGPVKGVTCTISDGSGQSKAFFSSEDIPQASTLSRGSYINLTKLEQHNSIIMIKSFIPVQRSTSSLPTRPLPTNTAPSSSQSSHVPVAALNNFIRGKQSILVKVTSVSGLRHWNNARGSGTLFSFCVADKNGDEIKVAGFNDVATNLEGIVQEGKGLIISNFTVKVADSRFNTTKHEYEISLKSESIVKEYNGPETSSISLISGPFLNLYDVSTRPDGDVVDVLVVLKRKDPPSTVTSTKFNKEITKLDGVIADQSNGGSELNLTVWGKNVDTVNDLQEGQVIVIKGAKVTSYRDQKSLSTVSSTRIFGDVSSLEESRGLQMWALSGLNQTTSLSASIGNSNQNPNQSNQRVSIAKIHEDSLGLDQPAFVTIFGRIIDIRAMSKDADAPFYYNACQVCNKKVEINGDQAFCGKCNTNTQFRPRFTCRVQIQDETDTLFTTAFDEPMKVIFNQSAADIGQLKQSDPEAFDSLIDRLKFTPFLCRTKITYETYNGENRIRSVLLGVEEVDWNKEAMQLYKEKVEPCV
ncbi:hypothetical protein P9112_000098 [Eukaryota sp. TZLM1-RC]